MSQKFRIKRLKEIDLDSYSGNDSNDLETPEIEEIQEVEVIKEIPSKKNELTLKSKNVIIPEVVTPQLANKPAKKSWKPLEIPKFMNSKIYNQDFQKKSKKAGIFSGINTDIIFAGIAFGLILGAVLFFFNGLQPLILDRYTDESKAQTTQLQNKYNQQTQTFFNLQNSVFQKVQSYNPSDSCGIGQLADLQSLPTNSLDQLKAQALPDPSLASLNRYGAFYSQKVESLYDKTYDQYETSLKSYNSFYQEIKNVPSFLDYRNQWINTCQEITASAGAVTKLQTACQTNIDKLADFSTLDKPAYWTNLETELLKSTAKCKEVIDYKTTTTTTQCPRNSRVRCTPVTTEAIYPNFGKWQLEWLKPVDNLLQFEISDDSITNLSTINSQFNAYSQETNNKIEENLSSRDNLFSKFYFLDIKL